MATSLAMTACVVGVVLLGLWARRRLEGVYRGARDRGPLEVVARVGLHQNQGLAVVRVGHRLLLVSTGEGGARALMELSADDIERQAVVERPVTASPAPALSMRGVRAWGRRVGATLFLAFALFAAAQGAAAQDAPAGGSVGAGTDVGSLLERLPQVAVQVGDEEEGLRLNGTVGTVVVLGLLALAPTLILMTTSFTRILIVLYLLRQALGTQNTPPSHLLAGLALLLSGVVMAPTLDSVRVSAVDPWLAGDIEDGQMLQAAVGPMRDFMLPHTRESDLVTFMRLSNAAPVATADDISNTVLISAFVTSELRTAFEIGFAIFLPFIVIDLVVAAVLTSMGMFMLPPTMIALPCKLMLFVLMDGWSLLLGSLVQSFA
jgi:flagellar biosynthetic protein FliP